VLLVWYVGANQFNRRRGLVTYQWLRRGLDQIGEISHSEWIGASNAGARLALLHARKPFRQLEATFVLETRELLPYWLLSRLWGRRDTLTIQANLRKPPSDEVTVRRSPAGMPVSDDQKQDAEALPAPSGFSIQRIESNSENGDQALAVNQALVALLDHAGPAIESLTLRKEAPHLAIQMDVKPLSGVDAQAFFSQLSDWLHNPFT
jgi:hypothetical protein